MNEGAGESGQQRRVGASAKRFADVDSAALVRSAQRGDKDAFGQLYLRYSAFVNGVLLAHADPDDAQDLLHDAFLHAWSKLDTLRDVTAFGGWIAQIARNMSRMKRRSALTLVALDDGIPETRQRDPIDRMEGHRILAIIRSLPDTYREPLVLRLVEGMSGDEIAARTGLTPGSVRVTLHRGMALLRQRLGERDE